MASTRARQLLRTEAIEASSGFSASSSFLFCSSSCAAAASGLMRRPSGMAGCPLRFGFLGCSVGRPRALCSPGESQKPRRSNSQ
jgi:hypothetical protein